MGDKVTDIQFLQDLFKKFVLAVTSSRGIGNKKSKRPVFKGWLDVTEAQSVELARRVDFQDGPLRACRPS